MISQMCSALQVLSMHTSISSYLTALADKGRSPLTAKAARGDLLGFAA